MTGEQYDAPNQEVVRQAQPPAPAEGKGGDSIPPPDPTPDPPKAPRKPPGGPPAPEGDDEAA
jgi:hypothetical protein